MPPRFSGGGPSTISPYQHQFPPHTQSHPSNQHPGLSNPSYLNTNAQINPFASNGALALSGAVHQAGGYGGASGGDTGLASQAARMAYHHGAHLQQQAQHHHQQGQGLGEHHTRAHSKGRIRDVWKHNLHEELALVRDLVDKYPYIAMDTEFPGVVSRPMGSFRGKSDYHYQCLRTNVDLLRVIQIGLTLFNVDGEMPPARPTSTDVGELVPNRRGNQGAIPCTWQFNFKFSLKDDMYNQNSIDSLVAAGIDFGVMERDGIEPEEFAALLIPSGLVCFDTVHWISFHGGYDFGYLTKLLHCKPLPSDEVEFDQIMKLYFPSTFDVKHLMKHAIKLHNSGMMTPNDPSSAEVLQKFEHKSGLEHIAEALKVKRVGAAHQAGSDSLLTGRVFFQMREKIFGGEIPDEHIGKVWGLMVPDIAPVNMNMTITGQMETTPPSANGANGGAPSTPHTATAGLVSTPAAGSHNTNSMGMGPMTPGGGGGVFGSFAIGGK